MGRDNSISYFKIFFLFSFFSHLIILYWIPNVMVYYGGMNRFLGIFGLIVLSAYISLFYGLSGLVIKKAVRSDISALFIIPSAWIFKDLILEKLFGGFPWEFAGYSQYKNTYFIQITELGGIHLISFIIIFLNIALYLFLKNRDKKYIISFILILFSTYTSGFFLYKSDLSLENRLLRTRAGIIQPNTGQNFSNHKKWKRASLKGLFEESIKLKNKGADFVIWPEYSIGLAPLQNKYIFNKFSNFALENIPLFAGFTDYKNSDEMYNSIMLFKKNGFEKYDKVRLVPFGEYIPFKDLFFFIEKITDEISDFTPGAEIHNLTLSGKKISTPICYEIIYPEIVRDFISLGGEAIILISNDSWYGTTAAPYHLLSMSVFRSIENRRYILRATSNGISAVIDPRGKIVKSVPLNTEQSFAADFSFRENLTFFTRIGYLFPYAMAILTFVFLMLSFRRKD